MTFDLAVVIPAFLAERVIGRALASVAAQTWRPREVVVVVDGLDDPSAAAAEAARPLMGDVILKVIRQEKRGPGSARNRGMAETNAEWVAFLDADDEWLPEKLLQTMSSGDVGDATLVATSYLRACAGRAEVLVDCSRRFKADDPYESLYRYGNIATSTVVARREALLAAGGFDEDLPTAQDFDLWLKVLGNPNTRWAILPVALTRYHVTPGSITSHVARRLECTMTVALRHARRLPSLWFRVVAIHKEAFDAYRQRGDILSAMAIPPVLAATQVAATLAYLTRDRRRLEALLWGWIAVMLAAYLAQFGDLAAPILRLLSP